MIRTRSHQPSFSAVIVMLCCFAALAGCGEQLPTYRYRLTVEVDTPTGLKTGSSVIKVRSWYLDKGTPETSGFRSTFQGEAVAVDIAPSKTLFALMKGQNGSPDSASSYARSLRPPDETQANWMEKTKNLIQIKGKAELPRNPSYPMLAHFTDINDPATIEQVDPDNLEAAFGEGFALRRITVEITQDPVIFDIDKRFPWWDDYRGCYLNGRIKNYNLYTKVMARKITQSAFSVGREYDSSLPPGKKCSRH